MIADNSDEEDDDPDKQLRKQKAVAGMIEKFDKDICRLCSQGKGTVVLQVP